MESPPSGESMNDPVDLNNVELVEIEQPPLVTKRESE